jgi:hypothetical protein
MLGRFISWLAIGVAAVFLVVASVAFAPAQITGIALGIGIGISVAATALAYHCRREAVSCTAAILAGAAGVWTVVASQVFSNGTVQSLTLASALAISGFALTGLGAHELSVERTAHSGGVDSQPLEAKLAAAA